MARTGAPLGGACAYAYLPPGGVLLRVSPRRRSHGGWSSRSVPEKKRDALVDNGLLLCGPDVSQFCWVEWMMGCAACALGPYGPELTAHPSPNDSFPRRPKQKKKGVGRWFKKKRISLTLCLRHHACFHDLELQLPSPNRMHYT